MRHGGTIQFYILIKKFKRIQYETNINIAYTSFKHFSLNAQQQDYEIDSQKLERLIAFCDPTTEATAEKNSSTVAEVFTIIKLDHKKQSNFLFAQPMHANLSFYVLRMN